MPQQLPRFQRMLEEMEDRRKLAKILIESGEAAPPAAGATSGGDWKRMRGCPIVARGVSGATVDSDPVRALLAKERRRHRRG